MFAKVFTVAILAAGHCQAAENWIRGGTTCVGVDSSKPETVMYGPCGTDSKASSYIAQTLVGGGLTSTDDDYWTNPTGLFQKLEIPMTGDQPKEFATRAGMGLTDPNQEGCEYAAAQASVAIGDTTNGGTFQYAAVISTGSKACTAKTIKVVKPKANGCENDACSETPDICINADTAGTTCVDRTFEPGEIKFSAGFGVDAYTAGNVAGGSNAIAFVGYRLKYDWSNIGGDISFSDGTNTYTTTTLMANQVESFTITNGDKSVTITTGGKYTRGSFTSTEFTLEGTTAIKVRAAPVPGETKMVYVDFLFDITDIDANKWVLYDPSVASTGGSQAGSAHVVASAFTVAILTAVAFFQL